MDIVSFEQLREHVGGNTTAQVCVNLNKAGIRFIEGKGGKPFTTMSALNAALGLLPDGNLPPSANDQQKIEIM